jgi:zinc transporter ZupT
MESGVTEAAPPQRQARPPGGTRLPAWLIGLAPLLVLGAVIAIFVALDAPGLERRGLPVEELGVERTELRPGEIELLVRNDGPDPVQIEQAIVNDGFAAFTQSDDDIGRLAANRVTIDYPWVEGEAYEILLLTATGGTAEHSIDVATESPETDAGFFGLMAAIGFYVGIIPVAIGMLWLPWVRRIDPRWVQFLLALTVGLLAFLGIDALLEGTEFAGAGAEAFGGALLVYLGAVVAYLVLAGVDAWLGRRGDEGGSSGFKLALLVSIGIGLHNLGEGLAIGSAYAIGSLALGAFLIVGFALHNTTEGLAIVAPVANRPVALRRLAPLGLIAGAPAILGTWIGASAFNPGLAAFMLGLGAGAIAQVVVQIAPSLRDRTGRLLHPLVVAGMLAGFALMFGTGLLISV